MTHSRSSVVLALAVIISIIFIAGETKATDFEGFVETTHDDPNWCLVISDGVLTYYHEIVDCYCFEYLFDPCCVSNGVACTSRYYKLASDVNEGHMYPMSSLGDICRCGIEVCNNTIDSLYVREGYSFQLYYNTQEPNDPCELIEASPIFCGPKRASHTFVLNCSCECYLSYDPATFFVPSSGWGALGNIAIIVYRGCAGIEKIDDVNENQCVLPGTIINYTINYSIDGNGVSQNVKIIDYVPIEVNYISSTSPSDYNAVSRIVTWNRGNLTLPTYGSVGLTVQVKDNNQAGYTITNVAEIQGNFATKRTEDKTFVCYSGSIGDNIICVDKVATGLNNGTSWDNAFVDFNDGLAKARFVLQTKSSCEIWVAGHPQGYEPPVGGDYYSATFQIPDGNIAIRGHFGGKARHETSPDQRDFTNPAYETIFDCCVSPYGYRANYIVTCENIGLNATLIFDGFTFTGAGVAGLYINHSDPSITRCKFNGNYYGIRAENYSYPDITNSTFLENSNAGIYSQDSSWPWVKNCVFDGNNNSTYGLWGSHSDMLIEDCNIKRYSVAFDGALYFLNSYYLTIIGCSIEKNNNGNGISCLNCENVEVTECTIQNNGIDGINCYNSPLNVNNCNIRGNISNGIEASESSLMITNNKIFNNTLHGIYSDYCGDIMIKNNWIYFNGISDYDSGLYFSRSVSPPFIRNNTIVKNLPYGIYISQGRDPCLINDIIWQNGDGPSKNVYSEWGLSGVMASYCDIGGGFSGPNNINIDPCFVKIDTNDFHLKYASPCIDVGDPNADYSDEFDIDGQCRVIFGQSAELADIGADEFAPKADYNGDSIVNFADFAIFAAAWKSTNSPSISLNDNNDVNIVDLQIFCQNWLWYAPCADAYQSYMNQSQMGLIEQIGITEEPVDYSSGIAEEPPQQSLVLDENQPPGIWLTCDGNMNPSYGDEVTVYVHSEPALLCMVLMAEVDGDANVTSAMSTADCNNYGWDNGWNTDPVIDPAGGWVAISGVSWNRVPTGNVGYFKFRYYGGEVTVYITDSYDAYDSNLEPVVFSLDPLVFGSDPNQ